MRNDQRKKNKVLYHLLGQLKYTAAAKKETRQSGILSKPFATSIEKSAGHHFKMFQNV